MSKFKLYIFLLSFLLCLLVMIIGGYAGHNFKLLSSLCIYSVLSFLILFYTKEHNKKWKLIITLAIPPFLMYSPIHILYFNSTLISLPSTLGHFAGIFFGILLYFSNKKMRIPFVILMYILFYWLSFIGYKYWLYRINFGTFTGHINMYKKISFEGKSEKGHLTNSHFSGKVLVLDFWNTRCGVCFEKFPLLQKTYEKYKFNNNILIYAVNKQLQNDDESNVFQMIKERGYTFPVLLPSDKSISEKFEITSYPTTLIIDKDGYVIFKGDIADAINILEKFKS